MKKWMIMAAAFLMVGAMSGCKATQPVETAAHVTVKPSGVTPETTKEVVEKVGQVGASTFDMEFFYYGNDAGDGLVKDFIDVEKLDEQSIADKLIENDILEDGCKVLSLEITGEEKAGPGVQSTGNSERIGTLDLSSLPDMTDKSWEKIVISSIVNTYIENYELDGLHLMINGKTYSSEQYPMTDEDNFDFVDKYKKFQ